MGPLDKHVLSDDALTAEPAGGNLQFRSHWYRSLPLSCMSFKLTINGEPLDPANMTIEVNGRTYPSARMPDLYDEWLFILDAATLHFEKPLEKGLPYDVEFELGLYIPYILVGGEGNPLLASTKVVKSLVCN